MSVRDMIKEHDGALRARRSFNRGYRAFLERAKTHGDGYLFVLDELDKHQRSDSPDTAYCSGLQAAVGMSQLKFSLSDYKHRFVSTGLHGLEYLQRSGHLLSSKAANDKAGQFLSRVRKEEPAEYDRIVAQIKGLM